MANTNIINAVFGSGICAVTTSAFRGNATGLVQLREYSGSPQTWGAWRTA